MFYLRKTLKQTSYYNFLRCTHSSIFYNFVRLYRRRSHATEGSVKSQEILKYFDSSLLNSEYANLSLDLFNEKRLTYFSYLMKEDSAKVIVNAIKNDVICRNQCVLEANPGFGFVTKQLLSLGFSKVKVFEPDQYFRKVMKKLQLLYPDKLDIYDKHLFNIYKYDFKNKEDKMESLRKVMESVEPKLWSEDCVIKIIGYCPSDMYLRQLVMNIVFQKGIIEYGRPELFLVLDQRSFFFLNPEYNIIKPYPVLYKIFFDINFILTLDKRDFLPWFKFKLPNYIPKNMDGTNLDQFILAKITPKQDLFERIGGVENLKPLWFFIKHLCKSSKVRVIPYIEKWLPGYGFRFLLCGVDTFTESGDLCPQKILDLFLEFKKWPEFPNSSFLPALESLIEKGEREDIEDLVSNQDGSTADSNSENSEFNVREDFLK